MNVLQRYLSRGWHTIGGRRKGSGGRVKVQCPREGCGLTLHITNRTTPRGTVVHVDQLPELSMAIANRRHELGLTAEDIDDCAGLAHRHVQKVEDAGRRIGEGRTISKDIMLDMLVQVIEHGVTVENRLVIEKMVATKLNLLEHSAQRPRVPNIDTVLLIVHAMGGRLLIDWGEPPRMTKRLIDMQ